MNSKFLSLSQQDLIKWCIMAVFGAILTSVYSLLNSWRTITVDELKTIWMFGLMTGISYLIKNLFTNSEWKAFAKEPMPMQPKPIPPQVV